MSVFTDYHFDGHGINDIDGFRTRLATFTDTSKQNGTAEKLGPVMAAGPKLGRALRDLLLALSDGGEENLSFHCGLPITDVGTAIQAARLELAKTDKTIAALLERQPKIFESKPDDQKYLNFKAKQRDWLATFNAALRAGKQG